jgi:hypothetical protein
VVKLAVKVVVEGVLTDWSGYTFYSMSDFNSIIHMLDEPNISTLYRGYEKPASACEFEGYHGLA